MTTGFIVVAALLTVAALLWVLPPLLRRHERAPGIDRMGLNLALLKDQLAELEAERKRGALGEAQYAETRNELERRVLEESATATPPTVAARGVRASAIAIGIVLPVAAALLYWRLGEPQGLDPQARAPIDNAEQVTPEAIGRMVAQLAQRLEREPDNVEGWAMLARSYYQLGQFDDAARAYEKLARLLPSDADLLAEWADALAMASNRTLAGRPNELLLRALELNPNQWKALALAGAAAFERKDYRAAVAHWERLRTVLPPDNEIAQGIVGSIAHARSLGGIEGGEKDGGKDVAAKKAPGAAPPAAAAPAAAVVAGTVRLSPELAARAAPDDVVFVFARAANGSRAPLAATKLQVKDLPAKFALDDRSSMMPNRPLSSAPTVIVGARISKSGTAMPASGDLEGQSAPTKLGTRDIAITIDRVLP